MKKVLVIGGFPHTDWLDVRNRENIELKVISNEAFNENIYNEFFHLVVFACEGNTIHEIFQKNKHNPKFIEFLNDKEQRKVAWSMDSHHQWQIEIQYQHFFHTYYLAHSNYIEKFKKTRVKWLPCSLLVDQNRKELLRYYFFLDGEKAFDIVSIYRNYLSIGDRNAVMAEYYNYLSNHGYSVFLGQTKQIVQGKLNMSRYYHALCSGRIVLNISIKDDLNMRNFEALALNQVMVTNRVPDHDKIDLDYSNTVFFDRYDLNSFAKAMERAFEKTKQVPKRTVDSVINKHMLIHRYVDIMNDVLGENLVVPDIDVQQELDLLKDEKSYDEALIPFSVSDESGDIQYDRMEIEMKAVYAFFLHNNVRKSFEYLYDQLKLNGQSERWKVYLNELLLLNNLIVKRHDGEYLFELLNNVLWEAVQLAIKGRISKQEADQLFLLLTNDVNKGNIIVEKLRKQFVQSLLHTGKNFIQLGRGEEALEVLKRVQELGLLDRTYYYLAAEANRLTGNAERAIFYYAKAVK